MSKRTRSIARHIAAELSRQDADIRGGIGSIERDLWRDPARRREVALQYREKNRERRLLDNGLKGTQPLPYVTPALRWSFHSTVGRNGAVRWHAHQVNAG